MIYRKTINKKYTYINANQKDIDRIKILCIPPQWKDVEISKNPNEKIQATGIDSKNRKQYIYHPKWVEFSKKEKFKTMNNFPYNKYKNVTNKFISLNDLSRGCVICNMLKIMEDLNIRVGNEVYLKQNDSIGLTTLMKKHLSNYTLKFKGKKGVEHEKEIKSKKSRQFIDKVKRTPGVFLFYDDTKTNITSNDLNTFLKNNVDPEVTCKDIRTYSANVIFLKFMKKLKLPETERERKKNITLGIKYTSEQLGNTPKVCRDSYISPENINKYL
jgi:DNA topoisomerase I